MKIEEIKLAFEVNVQFNEAENFINLIESKFGNSLTAIETKKKELDASIKKIKSDYATMASQYSKVDTVLQNKAKDLGLSPSDIPKYNLLTNVFILVKNKISEL